MKIRCVYEHNGDDTILYADNFIGAYARGESLQAAMEKMNGEVAAYLAWCKKDMTAVGVSDLQGGEMQDFPYEKLPVEIVQEKNSTLQVCEADSDVLFDTEKGALTREEYDALKRLALKSAEDFFLLYEEIPDKNKSCLPRRKTFYGEVPRTAEEMYIHTKNVNAYYFGEIGVKADNEGTIWECRKRGFDLLEQKPDYLENKVYMGSYEEEWSLRKVMRRFIWHDRIHAKAMYRMAVKTFGEGVIFNRFGF